MFYFVFNIISNLYVYLLAQHVPIYHSVNPLLQSFKIQYFITLPYHSSKYQENGVETFLSKFHNYNLTTFNTPKNTLSRS